MPSIGTLAFSSPPQTRHAFVATDLAGGGLLGRRSCRIQSRCRSAVELAVDFRSPVSSAELVADHCARAEPAERSHTTSSRVRAGAHDAVDEPEGMPRQRQDALDVGVAVDVMGTSVTCQETPSRSSRCLTRALLASTSADTCTFERLVQREGTPCVKRVNGRGVWKRAA